MCLFTYLVLIGFRSAPFQIIEKDFAFSLLGRQNDDDNRSLVHKFMYFLNFSPSWRDGFISPTYYKNDNFGTPLKHRRTAI